MVSNAVHRPSPVAPWQRELAAAIHDPAELLAVLGLDARGLRLADNPGRHFRLRVPRAYVARMRPGDPDDPLLRQVLPLAAEYEPAAGFSTDPVGDLAATAPGGILHKYHGRALLMATGACAVHCRYCFRRHFPYAEVNAAAGEWGVALASLGAAPDIHEVILSGGDPLSLTDRRLAALAEGLSRIGHVQRLRVHTRLPIVLPARVDEALLAWLAGTRLRPVLVLHANHANELDAEVAAACARLRGAGVTLLNQAVLLRGVNDSASGLVSLSERLFDIGVLPYYLHLLDRVEGAAHFEVDNIRAGALMRAAAARLPGYLLPRLVREEAGAPAKTSIDW